MILKLIFYFILYTLLSIIMTSTQFNNGLIKDTEILMYSGELKKIQDIKKNDIIMSSYSTPLKIINIVTSIEQMYNVSHYTNDENYIVNKDFILSLRYIFTKRISYKNNSYHIVWFNSKTLTESTIIFKHNYNNKDIIKQKAYKFFNNIIEDNIINISVEKFLTLPLHIIDRLRGLKKNVQFYKKNISHDPYLFGFMDSINIYGMVDNYKINSIYKYNTIFIRHMYIAGVLDSIGHTNNDDKYYINIYELNSYLKDFIFILKSIGLNCIIKDNILTIYGKEIFNLPTKILNITGKLNKYTNKISITEFGNSICYKLQFSKNSEFFLGNCIVIKSDKSNHPTV